MVRLVKGGAHLLLPGMFNVMGKGFYDSNKPNLEAFRDSVKAMGEFDVSTGLRQYDVVEATEFCLGMLKEVLAECDPRRSWARYLVREMRDERVVWVCGEHKGE